MFNSILSVFVFAIVIGTIVLAFRAPTTPRIIVSSTSVLMDEPVSIMVKGLYPLQKVVLKTTATDAAGETWSSEAKFQANATGSISLDDQAPISGSYDGIDGMGLFWTMAPTVKKPSSSFAPSVGSLKIKLQLLADGKEIDSTTLLRSWSLNVVKKILVREDGLVGTLFIPSKVEKPPVLILLSGSGGGVNENRAELFAAHGFATLTLAYFLMDGLPQTLELIPIEYFQKGIDWIKNRSDVDGSRIGLMGGSKGGELVLLLGSMFPESVQAIVATVPSSSIFPGCAEGHPLPAWTYGGVPLEPVAYMAHVESEKGLTAEDAIVLSPYFMKGIEQENEAFRDAAIRVENIHCPVMLVSGGDDQMWPSGFFSRLIKARCDEAGVACVWLNYPKAGHQIGLPYYPAPSSIFYHPVTDRWYFMGGSAKEDEMAKRDYWPQMLQFLNSALKS